MIPAKFLPEAEQELVDAALFYENRAPGLGLDFGREVKAAVREIRQFPTTWQQRQDGTRRRLLSRFPYVVVYVLHREEVWIVAVAHCKRRPGYWEERLSHVPRR